MIREYCDFCGRLMLDCVCPKPFIVLSNAAYEVKDDEGATEILRHAMADLILERECDGRLEK
jgi:hypothetical protein